MQTLNWRAYAKVNLCLSVGAPEPEGSPKAGWHAIASWMQCIDLFDDVTIQRLEEGTPSKASVRWADDAVRATDIDWPIEKDLAFRALKVLEAHFGRSLSVSVDLAKRIPVGGGLGGGSADAAAVLLGVPRLLGLEVSEEDLTRLAMSLGSDVAFFADTEAGSTTPAGAAFVSGFGDQIERVQSATSELVLVVPGYGCPTGPVYKQFDAVLKERIREESLDRARRGLTGPEKSYAPKMGMVEARWERAGQTGRVEGDKLFNDLAVPAYRVEPRLGQLVTALARATRETPNVTGSGSCVFFPASVGKVEKLQERVEKLVDAVKAEEFGAGARVVRTRLV